MLKDELKTIADATNETKKKKEEEQLQAFIRRNINNTQFVWDKYLQPGLQKQAKLGHYKRTFRFLNRLNTQHCYYCIAQQEDTDSYYNKVLKMPYDFPTINDGFFDLDTLIQIITDNGLKYSIESCPIAWSKASKTYTDNGYIKFTIYWNDIEIADKEYSAFIREIMAMPPCPEHGPEHENIKKSSSKIERNKMTAGLRFDIFKRDGYKCKICGRSAKDGVKLHVDHIVPIAKGGKTIPENLQTLCQDCNLGKGTKDF